MSLQAIFPFLLSMHNFLQSASLQPVFWFLAPFLYLSHISCATFPLHCHSSSGTLFAVKFHLHCCPHCAPVIRDSLLQTYWKKLTVVAIFPSRKPISFSFELGKNVSVLCEILFQFNWRHCKSICSIKGTQERPCHFFWYCNQV